MKKQQILTFVCFALILGIAMVGNSFSEKRLAVETAADRITDAPQKPVVVIDAGHGGDVLTMTIQYHD